MRLGSITTYNLHGSRVMFDKQKRVYHDGGEV